MDEKGNGTSGSGDWQYVEGKSGKPGEPVRILPADAQPTRPVGRQPQVPYESPSQRQPAPTPGALRPYEPAAPGGRVRAAQTPDDAQTAAHQAAAPPAPTVVQVKRGPTACAILAGTFAILTLSCALLAFATLRGGLDNLGRLGGVFPNFSIAVTPTVTINTQQPAVINQIRGLSRLETVNYQLEKVVTGKSSGPLPDLLTSDKILLVAHGEVVAGIDLSDLGPEDVTVLSDTVTIKLPEAQVLYTRLDNDKTYVYDRQTGIFSKPDPNLESEMRRVAEQEILKAALEDGILRKAQDNAETVIRTLVTGLDYKDVRFEQSP